MPERCGVRHSRGMSVEGSGPFWERPDRGRESDWGICWMDSGRGATMISGSDWRSLVMEKHISSWGGAAVTGS